jgi:hypothetical protein
MSPSDVVRSDSDIVLKPVGSSTEQRRYDAWQMRLRGTDWQQICKTVGYSSVKVAQVEVRAYITESMVRIDAEHREEVLHTELARLDELMDAVWDMAMTGDTKAVDSVLKVINTRMKLLGLDTQQEVTVNNNTVLVHGTSEEFIARLQLVE